MPEKSYLRIIDEDSRIRVKIEIKKGEVIYFMMQYELLINGKWVEVVRYDTSHNFAHKDIIYPDGTKEKISLQFSDFGTALSFAQEDVVKNYRLYQERYLKEGDKK